MAGRRKFDELRGRMAPERRAHSRADAERVLGGMLPAEIETSSGNVFADLGLPNADELLAKSELAIAIRQLIAAQGFTSAQAAKRLGTTQGVVSDLARGRLDDISIERLRSFLETLG